MFPLTWTLAHKIDDTSPLKDYGSSHLRELDARLWLGLEARDVVMGAEVVDTKGYDATQIAVGMRYVEVLSIDARGNAVADLSALGRVEPDTGPEQPGSGWDDS